MKHTISYLTKKGMPQAPKGGGYVTRYQQTRFFGPKSGNWVDCVKFCPRERQDNKVANSIKKIVVAKQQYQSIDHEQYHQDLRDVVKPVLGTGKDTCMAATDEEVADGAKEELPSLDAALTAVFFFVTRTSHAYKAKWTTVTSKH